jgi:hypothetical protein
MKGCPQGSVLIESDAKARPIFRVPYPEAISLRLEGRQNTLGHATRQATLLPFVGNNLEAKGASVNLTDTANSASIYRHPRAFPQSRIAFHIPAAGTSTAASRAVVAKVSVAFRLKSLLILRSYLERQSGE